MSYDAPQPPPQQPYGQPSSPYGQQPGPYGQQANPYGGGPYDTPAGHGAPYAHWGKRVGSSLVDGLVMLPFFVLAVVFFVMSREETATQTFVDANGEQVAFGTDVSFNGPFLWLAVLLYLGAIVFGIWNVVFRQGRTGRSLGKSALGTILLKEETGRPLGAGMTFVRQLCHVLDGFFYLGYLWPLWDAKRQTFADKIVGTVVLDQPKG
ncbi:Proline-rich antigen [Nocardioides aquaticus]|uniref:Proline-rich antigen n=1 Tax=Nocardioides aquaticus TaxID=160826 RepID=A0ABX8EQ09_9ACTN|nr:RDD family protein [Nocardioides aquaticus]QVT81931.1 Proline-rich antigen [Nocardioides aquaticus]